MMRKMFNWNFSALKLNSVIINAYCRGTVIIQKVWISFSDRNMEKQYITWKCPFSHCISYSEYELESINYKFYNAWTIDIQSLAIRYCDHHLSSFSRLSHFSSNICLRDLFFSFLCRGAVHYFWGEKKRYKYIKNIILSKMKVTM